MKRFFFLMISICLVLSPLVLAQQPDDNQPVQAPDNGDLVTQIQQLRADVERLSQQVDRLNDEVKNLQASGSAPPARTTRRKSTPSVAAPAAPVPPTVASSIPAPADEANPITTLAFKDGKRVETRNYAIVGESVWVYTETESKKYRLDDLDVDTTKKVNSDRGVSFQLPPSR